MSREDKAILKKGSSLEKSPVEGENSLNFLFSDIFLLHIATRLDLKSLAVFIRVCHTAKNLVENETFIWKSMIRTMGIEPEERKEPAEYKLFLKEELNKIKSIHAIFSKYLSDNENLSYSETKVLHNALIKVRDALPEFSKKSSENKLEVLKEFLLFYRALSKIFGAETRIIYYDLMEELKDQYKSVVISTCDNEAIENRCLSFSIVPTELPRYFDYDPADPCFEIANLLSARFSYFCSIFSNYQPVSQGDSDLKKTLLESVEAREFIMNFLQECSPIFIDEENHQIPRLTNLCGFT